MAENIINVENVARCFGKTVALNKVSLNMSGGIVLGLVGENGAGKTTLIKHLLGLLRAREGQVRVFGKDPVAEPEYVLARLGYLSEHREDLPGWMRIRELFRYTRAFYPKWDDPYAQQLCETFGLDPDQKIKTLLILAHRKNYDVKTTKKPLAEFSDDQLLGFFQKLQGMEDAILDDDIPF